MEVFSPEAQLRCAGTLSEIKPHQPLLSYWLRLERKQRTKTCTTLKMKHCNRDNLLYIFCGALCIFSSLYVCFMTCCVCFVFCFQPCNTEQEVRVRTGHFTALSGTSSPFCRRWGGRRWPPQTCRQRFGLLAAAGPLWSHWSCCILRRPVGTEWGLGWGAAGSLFSPSPLWDAPIQNILAL